MSKNTPILAIAVLLLFASPVVAESLEKGSLMTISVSKISVNDFVKLVGRNLPEGTQVVATKASQAIELPKIDNLRVSPVTAVHLLPAITASSATPLSVREVSPKGSPGNNVLLVVDVPKVVTTVVNARDALDALGNDAERLQDLVKSAMDTPSNSTAVRLRFHSASGLLFISGTESQTTLVKEIIVELAK